MLSFYSPDKCCQDSASLTLGIIAFTLMDFGKLFLDNIELIAVWFFDQYNFWLLDDCLLSPLSVRTLNDKSEDGTWGWRLARWPSTIQFQPLQDVHNETVSALFSNTVYS